MTNEVMKNETETSPEHEPEPNYEPNPELAAPETTTDNRVFVEPQVDLASVSGIWKIAFKTHWIFFSTCFGALFLYNAYQLYKVYRMRNMPNRRYAATVQILVNVLALTRLLALSIAPYELVNNPPERIPVVVIRLLFSFGYPCLFSGFVFVHKIFMLLSKFQVMATNALGIKLIALVLAVHYVAVVASELATTYMKGARFLLVFCALYYMIGCLGISASLLFSGRRVVQKMLKIKANLVKFQNNNNTEVMDKTNQKRANASAKVIRITLLAAVFGVLCALLYIYTLLVIIRGLSNKSFAPNAWTWLVVNTFLRLFELCLAATMSYAVGSIYQRSSLNRVQPSQNSKGSRTGHT